VWKRLFEYFSSDPDLENLLIDSTVIRAHPCAAGAQKKTVDINNKLWDVPVVGSVQRYILLLMG
jgi:hypothetical protein